MIMKLQNASYGLAACGILAAVLVALPGAAKKKEKPVLPGVVLKAETVLVVILPDAGEPIADPGANRRAQEDVEKALMKWGRFRLTQDAMTADLVIAVKRGTDRPVAPTIGGGPVDQRPVTVEQGGDTIRIAGGQGRAGGDVTDEGTPNGARSPVTVGGEAGMPDDVFHVYLGGKEYPLDAAPVWTYAAKNALRPPQVTAVEEFRKAVNAAEKAAAKKHAGAKKPP
ncbi:MAG TPA: hypothetical protein VL128_13440 [Candidatus Eisenbacteria bacterium]|nr:hypothetical protein [Candidatus Eisenbacteria bacterium]